MTGFAVIAALLVMVALGWVLPVLLRRRDAAGAAPAGVANLEVLRHQLAELDGDLSNELISPRQYEQARHDLERRVLEDTRVETINAAAPAVVSRRTALALGILLPVCAALLYLQFGSPAAISPRAAEVAVAPEQIEVMISQLAGRLEKTPDDANGWALLGRSYFVMQRFAEAAAAYERAAALAKDDAALLADYADALAMSQGRRFDDRVIAIVERALKLDPAQSKALAMAGSAAFERRDYGKAIVYWERLKQRAGADSDFIRMLDSSIAEAQRLADATPAAKPKTETIVAGTGVRGTVSLSPALAAKANPSDTVFVFARAAQGPRQPLAAIRREVKDLPLQFSLDDTHAMAPELKLSNYDQVVVGARISKSAQAAPQSGDLQGASAPVKVGATGVAVVIDTIVP